MGGMGHKMTSTYIVGRLTHQADARISGPNGNYYLPGLLEGEHVQVDEQQRPIILQASPDRIHPICADAQRCGGCDLQHMNQQAQAYFKQQVVAQALQRQMLPIAGMAPIRQPQIKQRRRARWALNQDGMPCMHQKKSHELVAPETCHILHPNLESLRTKLADIHQKAGLSSGHLSATICDNGIQLDYGRDCQCNWDTLLLALNPIEDICAVYHGQKRKSGNHGILRINGHHFALRPGVFLQPNGDAAKIMTQLIVEEIKQGEHILELFCGTGTFTAFLADLGKVDAYEGNQSALEILTSATPALPGVTAHKRDLFKRPLKSGELASYDVVVMDPPRDGARGQAEELARAPVNKIVYVSCNPISFARDGRILQEGGYQLTKVTPVDQFWQAHHVELVAVFSRW